MRRFNAFWRQYLPEVQPTAGYYNDGQRFLADIDALLTVFPNARLIGVERDPATAAASAASLVWHQRRIQSDAADARRIGAEWLAKTERRAAAATAEPGWGLKRAEPLRCAPARP